MTHDAYELSKFFADADPDEMKQVLLRLCEEDPHKLLEIIRAESDSFWKAEVRPFLQQGKKIDAIKLCRTLTGSGLKEAKDMVEKMQQEEGL